MHTLKGHTKWVNSAHFNAIGSQIVTASRDDTARIWDAQSGRLLYTLSGHTRDIRSAIFNAAGSHIVTVSNDSTARIWDAESGELLHTLLGHTGGVNSAVYNATSSQVLTASYDKTAKIWDALTGKLLHTLKWHNRCDDILSRSNYEYSRICLTSVVYNPTGSQIVTVSDDTARIWDAESESYCSI